MFLMDIYAFGVVVQQLPLLALQDKALGRRC